MGKFEDVIESYPDGTLNLALDTIRKGKQALVFCNTKRGAESQAEKVAQKVKETKQEWEQVAEQALRATSSPTKQCHRLAGCLKKGIAFHHSGLHSKQRELIETNFRNNTITIICATPTLAMGMDLPAYRSIIRDTKRFSQGTSWGMSEIGVLEYEQMAGRAGRPGKENVGEAILLAETESEKDHLVDRYIFGDPEEIYSKLAVEPVLRTYVLSLIASNIVHDRIALYSFFDKTFYAYQYEDTEKLHAIIDRMIGLLSGWGFLDSTQHKSDGFVSASDLADNALRATPLGMRVAQLYLDPLTAHHLLDAITDGMRRGLAPGDFPLLHLIATCLELRPLCTVRQGEMDGIDKLLMQREDELFVASPTVYSHEYEEFLMTIKTAKVLEAWIEEAGEDLLLEEYNVRPGELQAKADRADWLLYAIIELCKLVKLQQLISPLERLRMRVQFGAKEDLLPLLQLKGIGRVRARKLVQNRIRSIADVKKAELSALRMLLGEKMAASVKEQVGERIPEEIKVPLNKRKGQVNLSDYAE